MIFVLIESKWNVNLFCELSVFCDVVVLIESKWNVNYISNLKCDGAMCVLIESKWNVNYSHEYNRPAYIAVVVFDDCEIQIYYIECKFEDEYGDWEESYRFISSVQKLTY